MRHRARAGLIAALATVLSTIVPVAPATAATAVASELPDLLSVAAETVAPAYDRDRFEHWIDADGNGCNTRYEVLIEESTTPVSVDAGCSLRGGSWLSAYDGQTFADIADLQIDHVVALAEAWRSGASEWTDEARRAFANDLAVPYALVAVSGSSNQSKADKDPAEWLPANTAYACEYVTGWALMKYRWSLAVDRAEHEAIARTLSGDCGAEPVTLPPTAAAPTEPPADPNPTQTVIAPFTEASTRLGGADRYEVAIGISQRYAPGVPVVYVAKGTDFPDALSASAAAAYIGGPLLLTGSTTLHEGVAAEIARLEPAAIVVVGGTASISPAVVDRLAALAPEVVRAGGADRYEASRTITDEAFETADVAMLATGRTFPDALAASGVAGSLDAPVLLVDGRSASVPSETIALLRRLQVSQLHIAGGPNSVSPAIEAQLRSLGFRVSRFGGADRYEVAANINAAFFTVGTTAMFANGLKFADALSGAALAGRIGAPLFVTKAECLPGTVRDAADSFGAAHRVFLGGTASLSDAVAANTGCTVAGTPTISGSAVFGSTLAVDPGSWTDGTTLEYQWLANGAVIAGAAGTTFTIRASDVGRSISVRVTGRQAGYSTVAVTSRATAVVSPRSTVAGIPTTSGAPTVGTTLTANAGAWTSGSSLRYQWLANGAAISGATGGTFTLRASEIGQRISVRVTGTQPGYTTATATSGATAAVTYPNRTRPISGTWNCPSWAPIKGNADSMIYHMPSGRYYASTNPEECFRTEAAAIAAGYRKSRA
ncbi:cell wall-binding repeat-containing protein [Agrococcus sp. TF02-05]|uniref:cell wall-binding repeat-containing protein n=1 Tax=Agrococcus sp. TF02-05 TaxID=2815211 RepID=UPI001AA12360|nr:cell wall-binding repeat-containing protein [Agrococcus sp. TF02-05]MBO1770905.1 cell wall-binding repeat-containing protein [Agrococcus sp. TF02-05]